MKKILTLLICLSVFLSCKKDDDAINSTPNQQSQKVSDLDFQEANFGEATSANFIGSIKDVNGFKIEDVQIFIGNKNALTNNQGVFTLKNVSVFKNFAYVKAVKKGYVVGSRTIVPNANGSNTIEITLLKADTTETVNSGVASSVTLPNGTKVDFSGDFITSNNTPYSGQVNVALNYLEPNKAETFSEMPGMLFGKRTNGSASGMETYGMINVSLTSANNEVLNIDPASPATLTFPISSSTPNSSEIIPLWSFSDKLGYWIEEGSAVKTDNKYVATVTHFSWWNVDAPLSTVKACINLNHDNTNLVDYTIRVKRDDTNQVIYTGFSNNLGNLCGLIPANETVTLQVFANNNCFNDLIQEKKFGPFTTEASLNITLDSFPSNINKTLISGTIKNCSNELVADGYAYIYSTTANDVKFIEIDNGELNYNFSFCPSSEYSIVIKDNVTGKVAGPVVLNLQNNPLNLGVLYTCKNSGGIFSGDVILRSQEEVNAFGLHSYSRISGRLIIGDQLTSSENNITSLLPLQALTSIGSGFFLHFTQLTSLNGLHNVTSVGSYYKQSLMLHNNSQLTSLEALEKLTYLNGTFSISNSPLLNSLNGLGNIKRIKASCYIKECSSLTSLEGLDNLEEIDEDLGISNNSVLTSLAALTNIKELRCLFISNNSLLTTLEGLNNLSVVKSRFSIENNPLLETLNSFTNLTKLSDVFIANNPSLTTIEGLSTIESIRNLEVLGNPLLSSLQGLQNLKTLGGLSLSNNPLINSLQEFSNLTKLQGVLGGDPGLYISGNPNLTSLTGLNNLKSIKGGVRIYKSFLTSLSGLDNLTQVSKSVSVSENSQLTSLSGLNSLITVGDSVEVLKNQSLTSIESLSSLTSIDRKLHVISNNSLVSLQGLNNLTTVGVNIWITGNEKLTNLCSLQSFFTNNYNAQGVSIGSNKYNPTVQDIVNGNCSQ